MACFCRRAQAPWPSPEQEALQHYPRQGLPHHRSLIRSGIDRGLGIGVDVAVKADCYDVIVSRLPSPAIAGRLKTYPAEPIVTIDDYNGRAAAIKGRVRAQKNFADEH
jgi:hypothetical protein